MEAVVGLLVMLLGVSHGVETSCDGREDGAQCYGALGGTVVLQLMDSTSEIRYQWKNERAATILRGRTDLILSNLIENRSVFTPSNGTFRINELSRTDDGKYELITFSLDGRSFKPRTLQLTIQAPVSSVLLVPECLSQGEMKVSCSSEGGDSPQYRWTLDGRTLMDSELLSGNPETNNITLKQHVSGQLVCSVRNHVSSVSNETIISDCGFIFVDCTSPDGTRISQWVFAANNTLQCIESTTIPQTSAVGKETVSINPCTNTSSNQTVTPPPRGVPWLINNLPLVGGVLSALVLLLVVGVAVVSAHKKKQSEKRKEDDQELTYADVRVLQRPGGQMPRRAEAEVEYGQVRFTDRPRPTAGPAEDECVYAKVRAGR